MMNHGNFVRSKDPTTVVVSMHLKPADTLAASLKNPQPELFSIRQIAI